MASVLSFGFPYGTNEILKTILPLIYVRINITEQIISMNIQYSVVILIQCY